MEYARQSPFLDGRAFATTVDAAASATFRQYLNRLAGLWITGDAHAGVAMAVEFRLLGDVAAYVDRHLVQIGHARQRCVLAALLVDANRVVPADELIDRVWADRLPQRTRSALSGYLSRLRQILAGTGARIDRQPGGYLMTVDPITVDLHRFRDLTAEARATDDRDAAIARYEQALALWRGEALATLDTPWVNLVRETLDRQRLTAELDRNDLALASGRQAALLDAIAASAAAHPLDERLAGQLMLALYRCGRQAVALDHYQQLRGRLANELGIDPSPPLRQLHRQILAADPALNSPATVRAGRPVPRQLPAPPPFFTGRAKELAGLDALLPAAEQRPGPVVAVVAGTAGVGKTALAVHWAHRVAGQFGDGQLYVNLRGFDPAGSAMTPAGALREMLDALQVPPQSIPTGQDAQASLYRSLLAGRRVLVVLDNAREASQVRPLLPGSPGCLVVVTSRTQMPGLLATDGAHLITLGLFTPVEAGQLLAQRLGAARLAREEAAVDGIITTCAGLPLALTVVAARAVANPALALGALGDDLRDIHRRLDAFDFGDVAIDVRAVFSWSYHTLSPAGARLFRLLSVHPGPDAGAPAVASLAGQPMRQVRPVLAELTRANLLNEHPPGRYAFHDLLRAYATELAHGVDPEPDRREALHRLLDHYLHTAHAAALLLDPYRNEVVLIAASSGVVPEDLADPGQAMAWFTAEHQAMLAAIGQAVRGFDAHVWQLAWTLMDYFDRRGHWQDWAASHRTALEAAERLADRRAQTYLHRGIANAYRRLGNDHDARRHLSRALDLFGELGDHVGQAHTHLGLGIMSERAGDYRDSLGHAERSLALYRTAGDRTGQARALNAIGWCHTQLSDHEQALGRCHQALAMNRELDDLLGSAATWDSIGYIHHRLADYPQAVTCYQYALELFQQMGDLYYEACTLTRLGDTHQAAGEADAARRVWQRALDLLDQLDHPDAEQVGAKLSQSAALNC
jgi:DNA-binding SARP family transcriptional activator/tetratricopeptide (TPR) repeat protein